MFLKASIITMVNATPYTDIMEVPVDSAQCPDVLSWSPCRQYWTSSAGWTGPTPVMTSKTPGGAMIRTSTQPNSHDVTD